MQIEFYIDIWLLLNTGVNYVLLDISGLWWNWGGKRRRYLLGAFCGAGESVILLEAFWYLQKSGMMNLAWKIVLGTVAFFLIPFTMLVTSLGRQKLRQLLGNLICLWGTVFFVGGILFFVWEIAGVKRVSVYFYTMICLELFVHAMGKWFFQKKSKRQQLRWAVVYGRKDRVTVRAYYDSGNCLCEPYTGKPVILASPVVLQKLKGQLGKGVLIPYYSLGNEEGMIPAYSCKGVDVWEGKEGKRHYDEVMLAKDEHLFAHHQEYDLILHHSMV